MKLCLQCGERAAENWFCPVCNRSPQKARGFEVFAPDLLSHHGEHFDPKSFEFLFKHEGGHFWFESRSKLICWAIRKFFPNFKDFFEIGCGTGFVLSSIAKTFSGRQYAGSDLFVESLPYAKKRVPQADLFQIDARHIPFKEEFDLIGSFDVLEHIKEDEAVISEMHKALKPGGGLVLSVPQHAFLWSKTDDMAHHVRRYSRNELQSKLKKLGFNLLYSTSFVSLLLPLMMLSRLRSKKEYNMYAEFEISGLVNNSLSGLMDLERFLVNIGLRFPVGGSRLVVAEKL